MSKTSLSVLFALIFLCVPIVAYEAWSSSAKASFFELNTEPVNGAAFEQYPFLRKEILDDSAAQIIFARFSSPQKEDFLIANFISSYYCGNRGCKTAVYKKIPNGGYQKIDSNIVTTEPFYLKACADSWFLIFVPGGGMKSQYSEWRYDGLGFTITNHYPSIDQASSCSFQ